MRLPGRGCRERDVQQTAKLMFANRQELLQYSRAPYRAELIAGELFEMEPAGALHGVVAAQICHLPAFAATLEDLLA